jgi:hypothetical protein
MAKASITLPDGTAVNIEGSPEEIARVMQLYGPTHVREEKSPTRKKKGRPTEKPKVKEGPRFYVAELLEQGFFKEKRSIIDLQRKLEEEGHIYAQTSLSAPLLHYLKAKRLRRVKEEDIWLYTNR